ncbi:MAG: hypothetical protein WC740_11725 [Verrucomicrobiia bacterium]
MNISPANWLVAACVSAQTIQQLQQRLGMGKAASATPGAPAGRGADVLLAESRRSFNEFVKRCEKS